LNCRLHQIHAPAPELCYTDTPTRSDPIGKNAARPTQNWTGHAAGRASVAALNCRRSGERSRPQLPRVALICRDPVAYFS